MTELRTKDQKSYATEWADAEVRVVRRGESFKLEIRARDDVGAMMHHAVQLEEREAGDLRDIWLEIT